jgi:pSer/pThr/pTyr-binding forkhead associated (FHA) protein
MSMLYVLNGPDAGRSFPLQEGINRIGRSPDNDIVLQDETISRQHLKILRRMDQYLITDLGSSNGTSLQGRELVPGTETEVKEKTPIAMGMTVVAIGEAALNEVKPFLDSIGLTQETSESSGIFRVHRDRTNQKKLEIFYKISAELSRHKMPLDKVLQETLDIIFELLGRIDRAALLVIDPETQKIAHFVRRSKTAESRAKLPLEVIRRVIKEKRPIWISDSQKEVVEKELASTLRLKDIYSVLCIPFGSGSNVLGAIYLDSLITPYGFGNQDVALFKDISQRLGTFMDYDQFVSDIGKIVQDLHSIV